jgi:hypothetical protein
VFDANFFRAVARFFGVATHESLRLDARASQRTQMGKHTKAGSDDHGAKGLIRHRGLLLDEVATGSSTNGRRHIAYRVRH